MKLSLITIRYSILVGLMSLTCNWAAGQNMPPVNSPEIHEDGSVTFRIRAPHAESVQLTGNWMGFGEQVNLVAGDSGLWKVTVGPLPAEMYGYAFIVDEVRTLDPVNKHVIRDGTWSVTSALFIPGEASRLYQPILGPKGTVRQVWYESPTLDLTRRMFVYTPPGYEDSNESYPVLYLLHGAGGDEEAWSTLGAAPAILDNLIHEGKAEPMIVVMTNGNPNQAAAFTDSPIIEETSAGPGSMANMRFEESLVHDVIPYIESHFRVKKDAEHRALSGLSMGGFQTINTTLKYPDMFDYIGVMSMGFPDMSRMGVQVDEEKRKAQLLALKEAGPSLYWIGIGKDDFLYESVVTMRNQLDALDFDYTYRESEGGHTWSVWRIYLSELAPMLFR